MSFIYLQDKQVFLSIDFYLVIDMIKNHDKNQSLKFHSFKRLSKLINEKTAKSDFLEKKNSAKN